MNQRFDALQQFVHANCMGAHFTLEPITGDASFRRYYRLISAEQCGIVMDSDPSRVNNQPFVEYNQVFAEQGLRLPHILSADEAHGFFLLEDLGQTHLADLVNEPQIIKYYQQLIDLIPLIAKTPAVNSMKRYDTDFVNVELTIFQEWLVETFLEMALSHNEYEMWQAVTSLLTDNLLKQPQVTVHRDYHSRNLMFCQQQWVVIDYQDAVTGPVTYDLVSLLRDCYHQLPAEQFEVLFDYGYQALTSVGLLDGASKVEFTRWFDLVGLQRHLKAAGIFTRLAQRDQKPGYLSSILPTMSYITEISARYIELSALHQWLVKHIIPKLQEQL
ncbi:hypothetical protein PULV_a2075 [Pseudoalteromonas ulvae UL12]|uniref:aminoglycoside phosphotransferase family protein n=1 Tax=Pseudoalteromonas ulvae TaxID=107327 RepID=UPI00186B64B9|nr:phosphotransferase [Pseudoalteromonas ulvae]MBE0365304.1 hypothetical protein [Pseudoalteromonas ulvae UL12]